MNDEQIIWEEPPSYCAGGRRSIWPEELEPFKQRPDNWGRIGFEVRPSLAAELRRGQKRGKIDPGFEFRTTLKGAGPGRSLLYVRYTAPQET